MRYCYLQLFSPLQNIVNASAETIDRSNIILIAKRDSFFPPLQNTVTALAESKDQEKIDLIAKNKGQIGSGNQLRRYFFGDLEPLGVQTGGAGMVVSLYNKANDVTFSYCATYDVVVAVRKGKVPIFPADEVK
ncbi:hypothetical protein [Pseudanabaena sp. 'Roaring Creek']|uniref:hypothetical protein n=1 Tax=Pseudanabaena sp. 'Roaring Creek' TaxID=1681830 RepID=UPI0006D7A4E2|nr:hypothetical protein [Pseudanabaena sp. 'Roaring Creek']